MAFSDVLRNAKRVFTDGNYSAKEFLLDAGDGSAGAAVGNAVIGAANQYSENRAVEREPISTLPAINPIPQRPPSQFPWSPQTKEQEAFDAKYDSRFTPGAPIPKTKEAEEELAALSKNSVDRKIENNKIYVSELEYRRHLLRNPGDTAGAEAAKQAAYNDGERLQREKLAMGYSLDDPNNGLLGDFAVRLGNQAVNAGRVIGGLANGRGVYKTPEEMRAYQYDLQSGNAFAQAIGDIAPDLVAIGATGGGSAIAKAGALRAASKAAAVNVGQDLLLNPEANQVSSLLAAGLPFGIEGVGKLVKKGSSLARAIEANTEMVDVDLFYRSSITDDVLEANTFAPKKTLNALDSKGSPLSYTVHNSDELLDTRSLRTMSLTKESKSLLEKGQRGFPKDLLLGEDGRVFSRTSAVDANGNKLAYVDGGKANPLKVVGTFDEATGKIKKVVQDTEEVPIPARVPREDLDPSTAGIREARAKDFSSSSKRVLGQTKKLREQITRAADSVRYASKGANLGVEQNVKKSISKINKESPSGSREQFFSEKELNERIREIVEKNKGDYTTPDGRELSYNELSDGQKSAMSAAYASNYADARKTAVRIYNQMTRDFDGVFSNKELMSTLPVFDGKNIDSFIDAVERVYAEVDPQMVQIQKMQTIRELENNGIPKNSAFDSMMKWRSDRELEMRIKKAKYFSQSIVSEVTDLRSIINKGETVDKMREVMEEFTKKEGKIVYRYAKTQEEFPFESFLIGKPNAPFIQKDFIGRLGQALYIAKTTPSDELPSVVGEFLSTAKQKLGSSEYKKISRIVGEYMDDTKEEIMERTSRRESDILLNGDTAETLRSQGIFDFAGIIDGMEEGIPYGVGTRLSTSLLETEYGRIARRISPLLKNPSQKARYEKVTNYFSVRGEQVTLTREAAQKDLDDVSEKIVALRAESAQKAAARDVAGSSAANAEIDALRLDQDIILARNELYDSAGLFDNIGSSSAEKRIAKAKEILSEQIHGFEAVDVSGAGGKTMRDWFEETQEIIRKDKIQRKSLQALSSESYYFDPGLFATVNKNMSEYTGSLPETYADKMYGMAANRGYIYNNAEYTRVSEITKSLSRLGAGFVPLLETTLLDPIIKGGTLGLVRGGINATNVKNLGIRLAQGFANLGPDILYRKLTKSNLPMMGRVSGLAPDDISMLERNITSMVNDFQMMNAVEVLNFSKRNDGLSLSRGEGFLGAPVRWANAFTGYMSMQVISTEAVIATRLVKKAVKSDNQRDLVKYSSDMMVPVETLKKIASDDTTEREKAISAILSGMKSRLMGDHNRFSVDGGLNTVLNVLDDAGGLIKRRKKPGAYWYNDRNLDVGTTKFVVGRSLSMFKRQATTGISGVADSFKNSQGKLSLQDTMMYGIPKAVNITLAAGVLVGLQSAAPDTGVLNFLKDMLGLEKYYNVKSDLEKKERKDEIDTGIALLNWLDVGINAKQVYSFFDISIGGGISAYAGFLNPLSYIPGSGIKSPAALPSILQRIASPEKSGPALPNALGLDKETAKENKSALHWVDVLAKMVFSQAYTSFIGGVNSAKESFIDKKALFDAAAAVSGDKGSFLSQSEVDEDIKDQKENDLVSSLMAAERIGIDDKGNVLDYSARNDKIVSSTKEAIAKDITEAMKRGMPFEEAFSLSREKTKGIKSILSDEQKGIIKKEVTGKAVYRKVLDGLVSKTKDGDSFSKDALERLLGVKSGASPLEISDAIARKNGAKKSETTITGATTRKIQEALVGDDERVAARNSISLATTEKEMVEAVRHGRRTGNFYSDNPKDIKSNILKAIQESSADEALKTKVYNNYKSIPESADIFSPTLRETKKSSSRINPSIVTGLSSGQWIGQCVIGARKMAKEVAGKLGEKSYKPLPTGLFTLRDKIDKATNYPVSSFRQNPKIGAVITTIEGNPNVGHVAVVTGVDEASGELILSESNYFSDERVQHGRRMAINDRRIVGVWLG